MLLTESRIDGASRAVCASPRDLSLSLSLSLRLHFEIGSPRSLIDAARGAVHPIAVMHRDAVMPHRDGTPSIVEAPAPAG
jgi:hypothetical protein